MISQLLIEFDSLDLKSNVLVVGATNMPELIDSSLLRPGFEMFLLYMEG